MKQRGESFTPETVDEQVDQLLRSAPPQEDMPSAEMVQMLQGIYAEDPRLQRVWERLAERAASTRPIAASAEKRSLPSRQSSPQMRLPQERATFMQTETRAPEQTPKRSFFPRYLSQVAAVFLLVVLVGSLITVLQLSRQQSSGQTGVSSSSATPNSKPGDVVYTTPTEQGWASGLAWSTDGQRLAVVGSETHIWDAPTGQHQITLSLTPSPLAGPAWSPTDPLLAIPTANSVLVVDGQTGKTIATYPAPAATAGTGSTSVAPLVSARPLGGAPNFGGIAWSPDGKWIASTFSSATSAGMIQVWDPKAGKLAYTLASKPGWGFGSIAWSSDGAYIAASAWKWDGTIDQLDVWSVATRQIVFQQSGAKFFESLSWQPGTDNVASALLTDNAVNSAVLNIWNVTTKQLIKTIPGVAGVSWSPDGKEFVYSDLGNPSTKASVTILDVSSGQKVYTYHVSEPETQMVGLGGVWSPTGAYIATVESIQPTPSWEQEPTQTYVVTVWVA